ncbi:hypothetical protein [Negadavirga shengliensis]|uniref:Uncharacterized protein n=1 Tax=Negadavirga shengliensis TaxID=1389218 RepID=A0ABV9T4W2_9BACT
MADKNLPKTKKHLSPQKCRRHDTSCNLGFQPKEREKTLTLPKNTVGMADKNLPNHKIHPTDHSYLPYLPAVIPPA